MNGTGGDSKQGDGLAVANEPTPAIKHRCASASGEDITTKALRFLSTASVETLGGIAVGLAACTYLVLGRLGLVLIGILGGVVLHATWEGQSSLAGTVEDARREKGLDIVKRILDLREGKDQEVEEDIEDQIKIASFEGFPPETGAALNDLIEAVLQNYVKWWYSPILPKDQSFPAATRQTLTKFILSVSHHLSRKRPADTFLDFLTNSSSIVIVFLNELSSAMSATQGTGVPSTEAVYTYLSANPDSNLANVLNEKQQMKKFKMIAEDILQNFLEKSAYDCDPARIFLREILGGVVLDMTLKSCSKPEWINGWIVYLLEDGEPDFNQAIDAGMGNGLETGSPFHDIDGNVGNVGLAKTPKSQIEKQNQESKRHKKRLSRAEEAMEEAMEEAKRLSQLIAEEDAKKTQSTPQPLDDAPKILMDAVEENAHELDLKTTELTGNPPTETHAKELPATENRSNLAESPISPKATASTSSLPSQTGSSFTSFDQIVPQQAPLALQEGSPRSRRKTVSLTLHNANIIIHDDSTPSDKGKIRTKPMGDYLVQIEPASSHHPGWMIVRRYPDFETLHEVLRRIAQVSGVTAFTEQHSTLPNWKEHTKPSLRGELERYLRDACWYQPLAESEGMKRFLEKDQGHTMSGSSSKNGNGFPGIGWPTPSAFETMGKGMLDVLASAPKGVAEGGKVIGGGITGVFTNIGNLGQKKSNGTSVSSTNVGGHTAARASTSTLPRMDSQVSLSGSRRGRASEDSLRVSPIVHTQPSKIPPMERRPSSNSIAEDTSENEPRVSSARSSMSGRRSTNHSRDPSRAPSRNTPLSSPTQENIPRRIDEVKLPPPPSDIADDYGVPSEDSSATLSRTESATARTSTSTAPSPARPSLSAPRRLSVPVVQTPARKIRKEPVPLSEAETRVAVELLFAVINELYTLSSAWNIRRTLLSAAKTFLLRPNNPSLNSIQSLIQDSVIASNTSDAGIAAQLRKLRENTMPTEEESKAWPAEMSMEEKERLRIKARRLLVERGVPAALTGVMGQAATGEAMGRVFDCLQIEEVARGLMFGLLLQCVRAMTH
ncbi:Meiotically up-regulated protein [Lachnellula willkommii]|uniref:Meiotically up-regulated protein n=1 Tax=Lachnellula willkommii TaxID=215461 RepID=A0A559M834_9HELO|nr:Meiotically up-regulated protein [Lachnellula willkommii]